MLSAQRALSAQQRPVQQQRGSLQVCNALTRTKKEAVVEDLKARLEKSAVVFGVRFKGLDVAKMEALRRGIPESSSVAVAKNSLMRVAVREVPGWSALEEKGCDGDNAWIFVGEDGIADTVKFWNKFSADLEKAAAANAPKGSTKKVEAPTSVSCAVMDGKYMTPAELKRCESLPTKQQLLATIARLLKQPAKKVAVGVKMVPTKLAYGIKALAELDEDKSKLVGDVAKPKAA